MSTNQPAIQKLFDLLEANPELKSALIAAIKEAGEKDIKTLPQFMIF